MSSLPPPPPPSPPPPGPGPGQGSGGYMGAGGYAQATGESWLKGGNDKATTAIILAFVGLLCCGLLQFPAFYFGLQALKEADRRGGDGRGKAVLALALSGTFLAVWVLFLVAAMVSSGTQAGR